MNNFIALALTVYNFIAQNTKLFKKINKKNLHQIFNISGFEEHNGNKKYGKTRNNDIIYKKFKIIPKYMTCFINKWQ